MPGNDLELRRSLQGGAADAAMPAPGVPGKQTLVAASGQPAAMADAATELNFNLQMARLYLAKVEGGSLPGFERSDRVELRYYVGKAQAAAARCTGDPRAREALRSMFQLFVSVKPFLDGTAKIVAKPAAAKAAPAPAPAAPTPAAAAPTPAAAAEVPIPSPDPLLPLPTTIEELRAKTGAEATPAAAAAPATASAATPAAAEAPAAGPAGDHAVVTDMNGKPIDVHIKRDGDGDPTVTRTPDGAMELHLAKNLPADIEAKQVAKELKRIAETPRQLHNDLGKLYEEAKVARVQLATLCNDIASEFGARAVVPEALKGETRAKEKIETDYQGEAGRITDLARASIEFTSLKDIKAALKVLKGKAQVVREKDRFKEPVDGYRDFMLNVRMANGHIVEVQLHLKAILDVKGNGGKGHEIYENIRALDALIVKEKRALTPKEATDRERWVAEQKTLYDEAFEASEAAEASGAQANPT